MRETRVSYKLVARVEGTDENIKKKKKLELVNNLIGEKDEWIGLRHRFSKSVFDELKACYFNSKIKFEQFKSFYQEKKNFKQYSRFTENGFIIRKNCSHVRKVSKIWLKKYLNGPQRDQLHLVNIREFKKIKLKLLDFDLNTKIVHIKHFGQTLGFYCNFFKYIDKSRVCFHKNKQEGHDGPDIAYLCQLT